MTWRMARLILAGLAVGGPFETFQQALDSLLAAPRTPATPVK